MATKLEGVCGFPNAFEFTTQYLLMFVLFPLHVSDPNRFRFRIHKNIAAGCDTFEMAIELKFKSRINIDVL